MSENQYQYAVFYYPKVAGQPRTLGCIFRYHDEHESAVAQRVRETIEERRTKNGLPEISGFDPTFVTVMADGQRHAMDLAEKSLRKEFYRNVLQGFKHHRKVARQARISNASKLRELLPSNVVELYPQCLAA